MIFLVHIEGIKKGPLSFKTKVDPGHYGYISNEIFVSLYY